MTQFAAYAPSPLGEILLVGTEQALCGLWFRDQRYFPKIDPTWVWQKDVLEQARAQLADYFVGKRPDFSLTVAPSGTAFQQAVWEVLQRIPAGQTWTYAQVAQALGKPAAVRAVGAAIGHNPISIVIPCHRVIGSSGSLTGYAGGIERKQWLLQHEK